MKVILYADESPQEVPEEFIECLKDEQLAWENFQKFSDKDKKKYIDWIYTVKSDDIKIERMAKAINMILKGRKLID